MYAQSTHKNTLLHEADDSELLNNSSSRVYELCVCVCLRDVLLCWFATGCVCVCFSEPGGPRFFLNGGAEMVVTTAPDWGKTRENIPQNEEKNLR